MKPIDHLKKILEQKQKDLKLLKARGIAYNFDRAKSDLEDEIGEHKRAISHLEEMERMDKYHGTMAVIQLLAMAQPKSNFAKEVEKLKYQPFIYERVDTVKRIIKRTIASLDTKRIKSYNKVQLESTLGRTRSEIGWLMDALGL